MFSFIIRNGKGGVYFGSIRTDKNTMREAEYQCFGIGKIVRHKSASFYPENEKGNFYPGRIEKGGRSRWVQI